VLTSREHPLVPPAGRADEYEFRGSTGVRNQRWLGRVVSSRSPAPDGIDFSVAVVAGLARRAGVAYI